MFESRRIQRTKSVEPISWRRARRTQAFRHRISAKKLTVEALEERQLLSTVTWDGGGGNLLWSTAANWSGDKVPGATDDVTIAPTGSVTIVHDKGADKVASLNLQQSLNVTGGTLTVTGNLTTKAGSTLSAAGSGVVFTASGPANIDGMNLSVSDSATLAIPGATSYTNTLSNDTTVTLKATGAGSLLDLHNVTSVTQGSTSRMTFSIQAIAAGKVDLRGVTQFVDPSTGDTDGRSIQVSASGTGSLIDLSSLTQLQDQTNYYSSGYYTGWSSLAASNGGTIQAPALANASNTILTLDGTGTIPFSQIATFSGQINLSGGNAYAFNKLANGNNAAISIGGANTTASFPALTTLNNGSITVSGVNTSASFPLLATLGNGSISLAQGGKATLPALANVSGSSLSVADGVTLALPSVTSYTDTLSYQTTVTLKATGAGSLLDLHNVTSVTQGSTSRMTFSIQAIAAGKVDLRGVTQFVDPSTGDTDGRSIQVSASGTGSLIDLSSLTQLQDQTNYYSSGYYTGWSSLAASNGGTIQAPALANASNTILTLDGTGTIPFSQIATFSGQINLSGGNAYAFNKLANGNNAAISIGGANTTASFPALTTLNNGSITVSGVNTSASFPLLATLGNGSISLAQGGKATLPALANVSGSSLSVADGVTLALPSVTSYTDTLSYQTTVTLKATGAGSLLDLHNVTSVTQGSTSRMTFSIQAIAAGKVDLRGVTQFVDPSTGDTDGRSIQVSASGTGSLIDLSSLTQLQDQTNYYSSGYYTGWSSLAASNGGTIQAPALANASNTILTLDGTGTIPFSQIATFSGQINLSGGNAYAFNKLANGNNAAISIGGANTTASFPALTTLNNGSITVSGVNTSASFPLLATLGNGSISLAQGGKATLPALANVSGSSLSVADGVTLALPSVTSYTDTLSYQTTVTLKATGAGSLLDLHNVTSVTQGSTSRMTFSIQAIAAGKVDLRGVTQFVDPSTGDTDGRSIQVSASGVGSLIDLSSLTQLQDQTNYYSSGYYTGWSSLAASNGGTIQAPALANASNTILTLDGTGTIPFSQIATFSGQINLSGGNAYAFNKLANGNNAAISIGGANTTASFPALTTLNNGSITVSGVNTSASFPLLATLGNGSISLAQGGKATLPALANVSGSSLSVADGVTLALPSVTSYTDTLSYQTTVTLKATGAGSLLDLHNVTSVTQGSTSRMTFSIQAIAAGKVDLRGVTQFVDPSTGDTDGRSIQVSASGVGSLIDLSSLTQLQDQTNYYSSGYYTGWSSLAASNGGVISLSSFTSVTNTQVTVDPTGRLLVGTLDLGPGSILSGRGYVGGNLINRATVNVDKTSPGLTILGDFQQTAVGTLSVNVDGAIAAGNYSVLQVKGKATLAGTLAIARANSYMPDTVSDYPILIAGQVSGTFSAVTGGGVTSGAAIAPVYGQQVVVLSRGFDRTPTGLSDYVNATAGNRVFLDVTKVTDAPVEIRLYDPNGSLVLVTNARPEDPNLGDFGPFALAKAGTYHFQFLARPGDNPSYTWQLAAAPADTLALAFSRVMSGAVAVPGESQAWLFDAGAGVAVSLAVQKIVGAGQTLTFTLLDPDGRVLARGAGTADKPGSADFASITLAKKGTYRLVVEGLGDDTAAYQLVLTGPVSPKIQAHAARGSAVGILDSAWFYFSQPMDTGASNFSLAADILAFRNSSGTVSATAATWIDAQTLKITFPAQPADQPLYLQLSPEILTTTGIPLDQDGDGIAGEIPDDAYTADLVSDTTGPRVFLTDPAARVANSFDHLTFHFSETIDPRTVSVNVVTSFKSPGNANLLGQITSVLASDDTLTVYFKAQTASGAYTMTLAPVIADAAGNLMDQNRDGKLGQSADAYTATITLTSADLVAASVANPVKATHGDTLHLSWTVRNAGTDAAQGVWWDYVYLSSDDKWDLNDTLVGKVFYDSAARGALAANGGTYTGILDAAMPGVLPGNYRVIVRTDLLQGIAESSYTNNTVVSSSSAAFDLPTLTADQTVTTTVNYRQSLYYKIVVTPAQAGSALVLTFGTANSAVANELYVRYGDLPTRQTYDQRSDQGLVSSQWLVVYGAKAGTYYVLAAAAPDQLSTGVLGQATVRLNVLGSGEFSILDTDFGQGGTAGNRTIAIHGINFDRTMTVSLASGGNIVAEAIDYYRVGPDLLYATFDLTKVDPGVYGVVLQEAMGQPTTVAQGLEVVRTQSAPTIETSITAVPAFRRVFHAPWVHFPVTVSWRNNSLNDLVMPLLQFMSTEPFGADLAEVLAGKGTSVLTFFAFGEGGERAGILMPGEMGSATFQVVPRARQIVGDSENVQYSLTPLLGKPDAVFSWDWVKTYLQVPYLTLEEFDRMFGLFKASVGKTNQDFLQTLRQTLWTTPESSGNPWERMGILVQAAFDRFAASSSPSIVGRLSYPSFDIVLEQLMVTAQSTRTFETFSASVGSDGSFTMPNLIPGEYRLTVSGGAVGQSAQMLVTVSAGPEVVEIPLMRGGSVTGGVSDRKSNSLLPNASVLLENDEQGLSYRTTTTVDGRFQLDDVYPTTYRLTVMCEGYVTSLSTLVVSPYDPTSSTVILDQGADVTGSVVDATTGGPVPDAIVFVLNALTGRVESARTNSTGQYIVQGLAEGVWYAQVSREGFLDATHGPITIAGLAAVHLDLSMQRGGTIQGVVRSADGSLLRDATLRFVFGKIVLVGSTSSTGEYRISSVPREHGILYVSRQENDQELGFVDGPEPGETRTADVDLVQAGRVWMTILDAEQRPLALAVVRLQNLEGEIDRYRETDVNGRCNFEELPAGQYSVTVYVEDFELKDNKFTLLLSEQLTRTFILEPVEVSFTILGGEDQSDDDKIREHVDLKAAEGEATLQAKLAQKVKYMEDKLKSFDTRYTAALEEILRALRSLDSIPVHPPQPQCSTNPAICDKYQQLIKKIDQLSDTRNSVKKQLDSDYESFQRLQKDYFDVYATATNSKLLMTEAGRSIIHVFIKALRTVATKMIGFGYVASIAIANINWWFDNNIADAIQKIDLLISDTTIDQTDKALRLLEILAREAQDAATGFNTDVTSLKGEIQKYLGELSRLPCILPIAVDDPYVVDCNAPAPSIKPLANDKNVPSGAVVEWVGQLDYPSPDPSKKCETTVMFYRIKVPGNDCAPDFFSKTAAVTIRRVCCDQPPPANPCDDPNAYRQWLKECCERQCGTGACDSSIDCGSSDPNEIVGPTGVGDSLWVRSRAEQYYLVRFENDPEKASAPAAVVRVSQLLDPDLDWSSFRLGALGFGDILIDGGFGEPSYSTRLDLRDRFGIFLDISAGIDLATGLATWELKSIDPETGDVPFSPLVGFLPPNHDGSEGQGFFSYSVKSKATAPTGARIDAMATIVFDQNEPIDTPSIFNTIDAGSPTSTIAALPSISYPGFAVSWTGQDDANGSGVDHYNVLVSVDGGAFTTWLSNTTLTQATYDQAQSGHTYAFFSQAVDLVGNVETTAVHAEAQTSVIEPTTVRVSTVTVTGTPATGLVVQFADELNVPSLIASGTITSAVTLANTSTGTIALTADAFHYETSTHRMTITFGKALTAGTYELRLDGSAFQVADGSVVLKGGASGLVFQVETLDASQTIQANGQAVSVSAAAVPMLSDWNGDGRLDLVVGEKTSDSLGKIRVYLNQGTNASPAYASYSYAQTPDGDLSVPGSGCLGVFPRLFDWNGDGQNDLVLGLADGTVQVWTNVNTSTDPVFALPKSVAYGASGSKTAINVGARATPVLVDWNDDGKTDLLVGGLDGRIRLYLNDAATGAPNYVGQSFVQDGSGDLTVSSGRASAAVVDLDGDGRKDLVVGDTDGEMLFFRNIGTDAAPVFHGSTPILAGGAAVHISGSPRTRPFAGDFNGDSAADLLVGTLDGQVRLYLGHNQTPITSTVDGSAGGAYAFTFQVQGTLTAADDQYATTPGVPLAVNALQGVRANDGAGQDASIAAILVNGPSHGTVAFQGDGSFRFTPATGFTGVDSFTYALTRGQEQSNTASVVILVQQASGVSNVPVLTLTASALSSVYGESLRFTVTVAASTGQSTPSGLVLFMDGTSLLDTETLDANGRAVSKAITVLGAGSHSVTAVYLGDSHVLPGVSRGATVTVAKAPLTITANDQSMAQGAGLPALTVDYNGFVNGDGPSSLSPAVGVSTPATSASPAGRYPITPAGAGAQNYAISYRSGTLTVSYQSLPTSFVGLGDQAITLGTGQVTIAGGVGSTSGVPQGAVEVALNGRVQTVALDAAGRFQVAFGIADLPLGTYAVSYRFAGSAEFVASTGTSTLEVRYGVIAQVKSARGTVTTVVRIVDASGRNLGSAKLAVRAVAVLDAGGRVMTLKPSVSNKAFSYKKRGGTYSLAIKTKGLAKGAYVLRYRIGSDPRYYSLAFSV